MKIKSEVIRKFFSLLIIIFSISVIILSAYFGGLLNTIEFRLFDMRVNFFAPYSRPSDEIVLILLDQESINWANRERGWGWPWPRAAYGEIIDYLALGGAKSIAFDVLFTEPSIYRGPGYGLIDDDESFARSAENFGRVAQVVMFSAQSGRDVSWPSGLDKPLFELHNFESIREEFERLNRHVEQTGLMRALFPIEELKNSAGIIGNVSGWADPDHIFRRNNLFSIFDGKAVPGLSAASLLVSGEDRNIFYNEERSRIEWGDFIIPVDRQGRSILRYHGPLDRYGPYFAWQVLQSAENHRHGIPPLLFPEDFKDKYVFFGLYAQGLFDIYSTPISSVYAGVGVHVTMLDNILGQDFIRESPLFINLIIIIGAIILVCVLALYSHRITVTVTGTVLIFVSISASAFISYNNSLWLPMAAPLIAVIISFISTAVYNYATEGHKKRFIKSAFSQYLSPQVIEQIIADPSKLNLGGETREMTAIFTDVEKFSSISEALQKEYADEGPRVLVNLLNLYLTEMSNIILDHGGTIDKYEGDAIIAFFGAPVWTHDNAARACRSALLMKRQEEELYDKIMDPAGEFKIPLSKLTEAGVIRPGRPLFTRFGINTGTMVVGNMGTPNKMNYTIMGNAVNLSARLEGVNKQYNTGGILISEYTKDKIDDEFLLRGLSRVRVVGIDTPLRLFELLDFKADASDDKLKMVKNWEEGISAYENKYFIIAKNIFELIFQKNQSDKVAKLYLDRCNRYLSSPPQPDKWDNGVDNLTEK
ncbi:MAG: adenylate/guanylate cyclase domain-containing protein [Treponema sp.]|nr:adenylate/guanylate cyclase domain-containing protein [Treponema sp.]